MSELEKLTQELCYDHTQCGEDCLSDCSHYAEKKPDENNPYVHDLEQQIELLEQRIDYMQLELQQAEVKVSYNDFLEEELLKARAKATAYDRLMSGGKKTLKELANFLGKPVACDGDGMPWWFDGIPIWGLWFWVFNDGKMGCLFNIEIDCPLRAADTLTLPDGWREK